MSVAVHPDGVQQLAVACPASCFLAAFFLASRRRLLSLLIVAFCRTGSLLPSRNPASG